MVTTVTSFTDLRNRALPGEGYDGVVRVSAGGYYGTGVLLYDGQAVLTAAHLFDHGSMTASVRFETASGIQTIASSSVVVHPLYNHNGSSDLALVWLGQSAPQAAERYTLYRDSDDIGQVATLVGYGLPGFGATGTLAGYNAGDLRLKAENRMDADFGTLQAGLGNSLSWTAPAESQLLADFDDGVITHDALGQLLNLYDAGLGVDEGLIASGDSGGPAFIQGQLAGIATYTASLYQGSVHPDIDANLNSSFGEIAAWQRVSYYQQWIDQSLRTHYPDAPTKPEDVKKAVPEGNSGTTLAYFLLQFTGVRSDPNEILSVDFATRDGTAKAGQDYVAVHGTLKLYPGENQAVIPVEIVGDTVAEPDEAFYLDLTHPVGGSFGDGVVQLTAVRTIVNDDGGVVA
ncbi:Calx-beta domain-containing protein [Zoogloea sp. LCSB751]|uniref:Calx-beta domain-containing protein n=1 Tax=Zoogloea sp. LCSB751 TaxID=1965277 RepID=UPI0009A4BFB5|nr:Calx-beta domain-containing protein [Zoogloea sp. LCSB751]